MGMQTFKDEEVADGLNGVIASVDIIPKKDARTVFWY